MPPRRPIPPPAKPLDDAAVEAVRHELARRLFIRWGLEPCRNGTCMRMWCRRHGRCKQIADAARSHPNERWSEIVVAPPTASRKSRHAGRTGKGATAATGLKS